MALALFDAGYVVEAIGEIEQFGNHMKDWPGPRRGLAGLTRSFEARADAREKRGASSRRRVDSVGARVAGSSAESGGHLQQRAPERSRTACWPPISRSFNCNSEVFRLRLRSDPARARCVLRRTCSSRGSAGTARAARCCGSGSAGRRADRGRRPRAASGRCSDRRATAGYRSWPSARQIAWWMLSACGFCTSAAKSSSSASCGVSAGGEMA